MSLLLPEPRPGQMLSALCSRASARPHMTRHHHPSGHLLPDSSTPAHETGRILGSPGADLSFQSNLPSLQSWIFPFHQNRVYGLSLNFLHPLLSASIVCFPAVVPCERSPSKIAHRIQPIYPLLKR